MARALAGVPALRTLACSLVATALAGCSTLDAWLYQGYGPPPLDKDTAAPYAKLANALTNPADGTPLIDKSCFGTPTNANSCRQQRDHAVAALMVGSDELCVHHRRSIYGREASWNIVTGTLTGLFAGGAAIVESERRKTILSALALFTNAERSLVNETVYKTMIVTAVDKKIVETRDSKQTAIATSLKLPIDQYGMHAALRDVVAYHQSCSFMNGLQKALDEGTQGTTAQRIIRLRAAAATVAAEMATIPATNRTPAQQKQYDLLEARLTALSDSLKAAETQ